MSSDPLDVSVSAGPDDSLDAILLPPGQGQEDFGFEDVKRESKPDDDKPKAGPPRLDEWQHFFAKTVIKGLTEHYVDALFKDIDDAVIPDREIARLYLRPDEQENIAKPFSELANKSKFMRKHGRMIIASADSVEALFALSMWYTRVNRIAAKYRPVQGHVVEGRVNVAPGPPSANGSAGQAGSPDFTVWEGDFPNTG
jgi:hypothetical protein